jgi:hypothetical protein
VLRRLLQAATARGFIIDELSAEPLNGRVGLGPDSQERHGALNASPMVERLTPDLRRLLHGEPGRAAPPWSAGGRGTTRCRSVRCSVRGR